MDLIVKLAYTYGLVFELILSFWLFTAKLKRRNYFWLRVLIDTAIFILFCFIRSFLDNSIIILNILTYLVLYIISFGLLMFTFKGSPRANFFCFVGAIVAQHISYTLSDMLRNIILFIDPSTNQIIIGIACVCTTIIVEIILYLLFARSIQPNEYEKVSPSLIFVLSGILLLICIIVLQFYEHYKREITIPYVIIFAILDTVSCISVLLISYVCYISARNTIETELVKKRLDQYSNLQNVVETMNIRIHDLKHQIKKIETENSVDSDSLKDLKEIISKYQNFARVGNDTLSTILTEKSIMFEKNNIKFSCNIDGKLFDNFRIADINSLFGNAFDNAIEYLCTVPEEHRFLSIRSSIMGNFAKISIENYYKGKVYFNREGLLATTKENALFHGFGLKSIRSTIQKYHGNMTITVEDKIFKLQLLLPIAINDEKEI